MDYNEIRTELYVCWDEDGVPTEYKVKGTSGNMDPEDAWIIPWDYSIDVYNNHLRLAQSLAKDSWVSVDLRGTAMGTGYIFNPK